MRQWLEVGDTPISHIITEDGACMGRCINVDVRRVLEEIERESYEYVSRCLNFSKKIFSNIKSF